MKVFTWDPGKNASLKSQREISFEEAVLVIERGGVLDILEHPNKAKYPFQRIFVLDINGYACLVPFEEKGAEIVFKTIIPSRKATRIYIRKGRK